MTEDPFEELLADDPLLNVVELAVALFESVPFWVWILVALFVLKVVRDASSSGQADRTTVPRD